MSSLSFPVACLHACRYLLGKHKAALEVYQEAQRIGINDWEILHNMGLCYMYLKQYDKCIEAFGNANSMQRHDVTFIQLGKVCWWAVTRPMG